MSDIVVNTRHPLSTSWHSVPHLQAHFSRPIVVSELRVRVNGFSYDVYVSHNVGAPTRSTSEVVVIKRNSTDEWPMHIWDHDRRDAATAVDL